jgi:hypothetical protein
MMTQDLAASATFGRSAAGFAAAANPCRGCEKASAIRLRAYRGGHQNDMLVMTLAILPILWPVNVRLDRTYGSSLSSATRLAILAS